MHTEQAKDVEPDKQIRHLVESLRDSDGLQRQLARIELVRIGRAAVPYLIAALRSPDQHVRWEAAEALAEAPDAAAASALVHCLRDEDIEVRWAASRALIALKRAAIPPLLDALTVHFSSPWLRLGAHHVLHTLKRAGMLTNEERKVFQTLHGTLANTAELPWRAQEALEALSS